MKRKISITVLVPVLVSLVLSACAVGKNKNYTDETLLGTTDMEGFEITAYFYKNEDGSAILDLCDSSGTPFQSFDFPVEGEYYTNLDYEYAIENGLFQDMNFDGYKDLYIPCSVITPNLEGMAWLWDTEKDEFVLSDELSRLYELTVFSDEELITSQDYAHENGILCSEYKWENGKLVKTGEYTVHN